MSTHNICFHGEIRKLFTGYPPLSKPMLMFSWRNKNIYLDTPLIWCYCIQPNNCTVHLGCSKLLGNLVVKYASTHVGYTFDKISKGLIC